MPTKKPIAGSDAPRPLKTEYDEQRYTPTPRREALQAPTIGIFEEPTRCLRINKAWWSHVSGMIDVLSSPELWQGDSEEKTRAITEIAALLAYDDCEGSMATKEDIRDGFYEAMNRLAAQIVSGRFTDIFVDEDGVVSDPSDSTGGEDSGADSPLPLPSDDPATELNETLAAKSGGCISIRTYVQDICNNVALWHSHALTESEVVGRLENVYGLTGTDVDNYVAYYYSTATSPDDAPTISDTLDSTLFCRGVSVASIFYYIYNQHAVSGEKTELEFLAKCFTEEIITSWYGRGILVPSTDYNAYICTKIPVEEFDLDMSTAEIPEYFTSGVWKAGHRFLIEVSGSWGNDTTFPTTVGDAMYFHDLVTGIKDFSPLHFNFSGGVDDPVQAQVPFQDDHVYAFTVDRNTTTGSSAGIISKSSGGINLPDTTGVLHVKVTDLGQYAL